MSKDRSTKSILQVGLLLAFSALTGTGVMAITHYHTKERIEENQRQVLIRGLTSVLPHVQYNNDLVNDVITVTDRENLGSKKPLSVYRARFEGEPRAVIITSVAPNGYNGPIKIIVGITYDGVISGVRVVDHRETPGLGDAIDAERSDWVAKFSSRSSKNTSESQWRVKKDGGVFDQFTGATITPRAVVSAVHKSLRYFDAYRDELFVRVGTTTTAGGQQPGQKQMEVAGNRN
ncbi:electron transport complex subunit RsxG [Kaarinaea lacus]